MGASHGYLQKIGHIGEMLAEQHMKQKGYRVLDRNIHNRWGEIDLVMQKNNTIVFVEVKTRTGYQKGRPSDSIHYYKLKHLQKTIRAYVSYKKLTHAVCALDIIGIVLDKDYSVKELKHYENIPFSIDY